VFLHQVSLPTPDVTASSSTSEIDAVTMDNASVPLADYFWIAGIENIVYTDPPPAAAPPLDATISEDNEPGLSSETANSTPVKLPPRHSRQNSGNRLSKLSNDARLSIHTLEGEGNTMSNRSSATIRPVNGLAGTPDFDFDKALFKFAAEREDFLDDLSFSAGAKLHSRPPMVVPRAERIKADENSGSGRISPLRSIKGSIKGSIRRKMSFREMSSSRKQPVVPRTGQSSLARVPSMAGS
jgi:hypothetical protein